MPSCLYRSRIRLQSFAIRHVINLVCDANTAQRLIGEKNAVGAQRDLLMAVFTENYTIAVNGNIVDSLL